MLLYDIIIQRIIHSPSQRPFGDDLDLKMWHLRPRHRSVDYNHTIRNSLSFDLCL